MTRLQHRKAAVKECLIWMKIKNDFFHIFYINSQCLKTSSLSVKKEKKRKEKMDTANVTEIFDINFNGKSMLQTGKTAITKVSQKYSRESLICHILKIKD